MKIPVTRVLLIGAAALLMARPCPADIPPACLGANIRVGTFSLLLAPPKGGPSLPIDSVNMIQKGDRLLYEPIMLPPIVPDKARVAILLVSSSKEGSQKIVVLPAKPAREGTSWKVPFQASLVGVVVGPQGLNVKKVSSVVTRNPDLIAEMAQYAKKTATVNALVLALTQYEQAPPGSEDLNSLLQGFSAQYNVALPMVSDRTLPSSMQAAVLLQNALPSLSTDNAAVQSATAAAMQQSAGMAATVAALFYGTPAVLAVGGASVFQNLRAALFPGTDLRGAFTVPEKQHEALNFCSAALAPKPRTHIAYLWVMNVPDKKAPAVSLQKAEDLAEGTSTTLNVTCATNKELSLLPRARAWKLVDSKESVLVPVKVKLDKASDALTVDLRKVKIPQGEYQLAALWDWSALSVKGNVQVRSLSNFSGVKIDPASADLLVQGHGKVDAKLMGANFEFVKDVALLKDGAPQSSARKLTFSLPKGYAQDDQLTMTVHLSTYELEAGKYALLLTQPGKKTQDVPITVHPPNPIITNLPLRANLGETEQSLLLQGTDLDRIAAISSPEATWSLAPLKPGARDLTERRATIKLLPGAHLGALLVASIQVAGLNQPLSLPGALQIAGPLPHIASARTSFTEQHNVALREGELPSGSPVSFNIEGSHFGSRPELVIGCSNAADAKQTLTLHPGDRSSEAQLDDSGDGSLFLSLDPGRVGDSGCDLTASVNTSSTGASAPYALGRVVRLPRIDKFTLSDSRVIGRLYSGTLTGENLQLVQMAGWNASHGYPVQGIPTPVAGNSGEQTLEIELPWPPPLPHSSLYIWLLGENQGRRTDAAY
jgi:hypothetical protein